MSTTTSSTQGLTATGVPKIPLFLTILRVAALVLSLGVLIAAAYHISLYKGYAYYFADSGPASFLIFDSIFTFLILGAMLAAEFFAPQLYIRLAFIGALILAAIFWLSAWAWAASWAASFYDLWDGYSRRYYSELSPWGASMAAGAALGAVTWVLIIVIIVFFVKACMASPHSSSFSPRPQNDAEMGQPKPEGAHIQPVQPVHAPQ
ncbi:hypothetical protein FDECE_15203 [Fusarium decemcellulare]|nr:hypothetical protein FDECE_15203 [Fusarium decemcellulare]